MTPAEGRAMILAQHAELFEKSWCTAPAGKVRAVAVDRRLGSPRPHGGRTERGTSGGARHGQCLWPPP